jgi:hypothetical protein
MDRLCCTHLFTHQPPGTVFVKRLSTPEGTRTSCSIAGKTVIRNESGAESGALGARTSAADAELAELLGRLEAAWPTLPDAIKAGILALVNAASRPPS